MTERSVEIPFLLKYAIGPKILDVGADRVGYTKTLRERGYIVHSVDPATKADFHYAWEDMPQYEMAYNTIMFISSMEHFDNSKQNLERAQAEVYSICRCREFLPVGGRIILTVPFGKEYICMDFINFSIERIRRIQLLTDMQILGEEVYRFSNGIYTRTDPYECGGILYRGNGAEAAGAVYCGAWTI